MKRVKTWQAITAFLFFCGCAADRHLLTDNDLRDDRLVLLGVIEYDFSGLKNNRIQGVQLYMESKNIETDFTLPRKYLSKENKKKMNFISLTGSYGDYELCSTDNTSFTPETDNMLAMMRMERNAGYIRKKVLQHYTLEAGKIINLGKITVQYQGGDIQNGKIAYTSHILTEGNDTTALHAFRETYPALYNQYKDEIYCFKTIFDDCLNYLLNHISTEKKAYLEDLIHNNPGKVRTAFKDLNPKNMQEYSLKLEALAMDAFIQFLNTPE